MKIMKFLYACLIILGAVKSDYGSISGFDTDTFIRSDENVSIDNAVSRLTALNERVKRLKDKLVSQLEGTCSFLKMKF